MKWRTAVSRHKDGEPYLRGEKLTDLIETTSFPQAAFLAISGRMPDKNEERMWNAILVAGIEHGVEVPTAFLARTVASVGNSVSAAVAAGVLGVGEWHGGAIEAAMKIIMDERLPADIARESREKKTVIPGFGHKVYKDEDPRAAALCRLAGQLGFGKKYLARARDIEKELEQAAGRKLPLNVDGAIAAVLCEFGFHPRLGKAVFAFARMPGIMAHIDEELRNEKPYRRFDEKDVEYI